MGADFVLNVRQIAQYPSAASLNATDAILVQQGGAGGAYVYATPAAFVSYLTAQDVSVASLTLPTPGSLKWNTATPASLTFNGSSLTFTQGTTTTLTLNGSGNLSVPGSVTVGADPTSPLQAATKQYVDTQITDITTQITDITDNSVWSFNGRQGPVTLTVSDIANLGFARLTSPTLFGKPLAPTAPNPWQQDFQIATTQFVSNAIAANVDKLLCLQPLVFTFNGRKGDICLTLEDVTSALFSGKPTAPTPAWHDSSTRIATTRFVERELTSLNIDVAQQISDLSTVVNQNIDESALATKAYVNSTFAPLASAQLSGTPTSTTPPPGNNGARIATTAFVMNAVAESTAGVATFNGRTGTVVLTPADLAGVNGAALTSPAFTGVPTAPTAAVGTNTQQLATTAFVLSEISAVSAGVVTFNGRSGEVTLQAADLTPFGFAPLASPALTGVPTAPTAAPLNSSTQVATTAFVTLAIAAAMAAAVAGVSSFEGRTGAVLLTANDISARGGALLASPALTGVPTAPTAAASTNTTQIATCAFVTAALAAQSGVASFNTRSGAVTLALTDLTSLNAAIITASTTAPLAPVANQLWWDPSGAQLYVNNNNQWVIAVNPPLGNYMPVTGGIFSGPVTIPTGSSIKGITNATSAQAGEVGELISSSSPSISLPATLSSATFTNLGVLNLTAGDWDIYANYDMTIGTVSTTGVANFWVWLGNNNIALGQTGNQSLSAAVAFSGMTWDGLPFEIGGIVGPVRINSASAFAASLRGNISASGTFSGSGAVAWTISARRVR